MADRADIRSLAQCLEAMHHAVVSKLCAIVPVREEFHGEAAWEGTVHVFELKGHPTATRAYAWSSPIKGSDKRRFYAVLHVPPVSSAADAARAAIVADYRGKR